MGVHCLNQDFQDFRMPKIVVSTLIGECCWGKSEIRNFASGVSRVKLAPTKRKGAVTNRTYQIGVVRLQTAPTVVGAKDKGTIGAQSILVLFQGSLECVASTLLILLVC